MFLRYYNLTSQPFGVTPDPRYLHLSPTHREAMASVFSGVMQNRGFTALIAHPGMGKTTLLFDLLQRIPRSLKTVFLFQTQCSERDLIRSILADLGVHNAGDDLAGMQAKLNGALLREASQGRRVIVLVDEAHNLDDSVLEGLRVLSNFETGQDKLLHIVLAGQPELARKLASPALEQLRQRVSVVARIAPLNPAEGRAYIEHRLRIAGYNAAWALFTDSAYDLIATHSQGIPRNINTICFNAMSIACALQQRTIGPEVIREVLRDLDLRSLLDEVPQPGAARMLAPASKLSPMKAMSKWSWTALEQWALAIVAVAACLPFFELYRHADAPNLTVPSARLAVKAAETKTVPVASAEISALAFSNQLANSGTAGLKTSANGAAPPLAVGGRGEARIVCVHSKDTLSSLCLRTLGRYDDQILAAIKMLNPCLSNANRLRIGQLIRMPAREAIFTAKVGAPQMAHPRGKNS